MPNTPGATTSTAQKPAVFRCDKCGFELPVKAGLLGMRVKCPKCGHVGKVLAPANGHNGVRRAEAGSHARRCPFCQEVLEESWFAGSDGAPAGTPTASGEVAHGTEGGAAAHSASVTNGKSVRAAPSSSNRLLAGGSVAAITGFTPREVREPKTRCPFCHEDIFAGSRKCKHCGEFLDEDLRSQRLSTAPKAGPARRGPGLSLSLSDKRVKIAALAAGGAVVLVGLIFLAVTVFGGSGKNDTGVRPRADGQGSSGGSSESSGGAVGGGHSSIEPLSKGLRQALATAELKDATGTMRFASGTDAEPWNSQVLPGGAAGKGKMVVITLPYQFAGAGRVPSTRGKLVLELSQQGPQWILEKVFREARFRGAVGQESEIPEEDRQRAADTAFLPALQEIVRKAQAGAA